MAIKVLVACLLLVQSSRGDHDKCTVPSDSGDNGARYPPYSLRFEDLRNTVMEGNQQSVPYYEIYSLNPTDTVQFGLPILRKVRITWNLVTPLTLFPGNFTNNYDGWLPWESRCEGGLIVFQTQEGVNMKFRFLSVYPTEQWFIGTAFSSCPDRYLINWYCPENELIPSIRNPKYCRTGVRMSIYSPTGPQRLPWHLIVEDLCKNGMPKLDDIRWHFTYDAPEQCPVNTAGRRKRSDDDRHYL